MNSDHVDCTVSSGTSIVLVCLSSLFAVTLPGTLKQFLCPLRIRYGEFMSCITSTILVAKVIKVFVASMKVHETDTQASS